MTEEPAAYDGGTPPESRRKTAVRSARRTFKCAECLREGKTELLALSAYTSIEELDAHLAADHDALPPCERRLDALCERVDGLEKQLAAIAKAFDAELQKLIPLTTPPIGEITTRLDTMQQEIDSGWDAIAGLQSWHSEMTELSIRYMGELVDAVAVHAAKGELPPIHILDRIEKRLFWDQP